MSVRIASGRFKGRKIRTVSGPGYRPAMDKVRQAVFSMLEARGITWEESRVLDLFAGSGSLGLEALSRGAQCAWFVERSGKAISALRQTLTHLEVPAFQYRLIVKKVDQILHSSPPVSFDVIFIDPPYGYHLLTPTLQALSKSQWLVPHGLVVGEVEAGCQVEAVPGFEEIVNRTYGQTRIVLWTVPNKKQLSIQEPSTL